jgi:hypothetical protein
MKPEMDKHKPEKRTELALEIYDRYSKVYVEEDITMKLEHQNELLSE